MPRCEPLIKSTAGQIIGAILIIGGGLWWWDHRGRPGPRHRNTAEIFTTGLALMACLIFFVPFYPSTRKRGRAFLICTPIAAGLGWGTYALQQATQPDLTTCIIFGAVCVVLLGSVAILEEVSAYQDRKASKLRKQNEQRQQSKQSGP